MEFIEKNKKRYNLLYLLAIDSETILSYYFIL